MNWLIFYKYHSSTHLLKILADFADWFYLRISIKLDGQFSIEKFERENVNQVGIYGGISVIYLK